MTMLVRDVICQSLKPLRVIDTAREALTAMVATDRTALPVVDQTTNRFIGMVTRDAVEKLADLTSSVLSMRESNWITTDSGQNVLDAARVMEKYGISLLPVLDSDRKYMGVVDRRELHDHIVKMMNFTEYGSLITIHFEERDFTLSKPVRIIEEDGGLILGLSVESPQPHHPFYVASVKLNLTDPARIVASLRRHGYIVDQYGADDQEDKRYEQRADELMHYLNI